MSTFNIFYVLFICFFISIINALPINSVPVKMQVTGFMDTHVHQLGSMAFAGAWFAKGANGSFSFEGKILI